MTYEILKPGKDGWSDWQIWPRKFDHACCDCHSVHNVQMKVDRKGNVWMRWRSDLRATAASRRVWPKIMRDIWRKFYR